MVQLRAACHRRGSAKQLERVPRFRGINKDSPRCFLTASRATVHFSYLASASKPRFLQDDDVLCSPELPPLSIHRVTYAFRLFHRRIATNQGRLLCPVYRVLRSFLIFILPFGGRFFKRESSIRFVAIFRTMSRNSFFIPNQN